MIHSRPETRFRGRWTLEGDHLCLPDYRNACGRRRRTPAGRLIWASDNGTEFLATQRDGDPAELVRQVKEVFPYPKPPPVPEVLAGLAHPAMGW